MFVAVRRMHCLDVFGVLSMITIVSKAISACGYCEQVNLNKSPVIITHLFKKQNA